MDRSQAAEAPAPIPVIRYDGDGMDLTEEDIFKMKQLRPIPQGSEDPAEQSVMSVADSTSNFGEHVPSSDWVQDDREDLGDSVGSYEDDRDDDYDNEANRFYGNFVFNRRRATNPELPSSTVTVLNYPFEAPTAPEGENEEEFKRAFAESKAYLIGTAHFSPESQEDVIRTIEMTQPDLVMVELCPSRISILSMDEETLLAEAQNLNREKILMTIKQSGLVQGVMHVLLLSMSAHITKQLGMAPGGEFRAAYRGSQQVKGCRLILGDRPIQVTLQRALNSLNLWQKMRLFWHIIVSHKSSISQEDVERCKQSDLLEELLREMAGEFPDLTRIFVDERDQYMANGLRTLLRNTTVAKRAAMGSDTKWQPVTVVAVVGIGHVPGMVANWQKQVDITALLSVPTRSRWSRYTALAVKGALVGVTVYACYRFGSYATKYFVKK
uniref:TraB domain-containing protein n=1 Tax=Plectus sambesii TaxID=2011161 RepID=A0A914UXI3_9BILA